MNSYLGEDRAVSFVKEYKDALNTHAKIIVDRDEKHLYINNDYISIEDLLS